MGRGCLTDRDTSPPAPPWRVFTAFAMSGEQVAIRHLLWDTAIYSVLRSPTRISMRGPGYASQLFIFIFPSSVVPSSKSERLI